MFIAVIMTMLFAIGVKMVEHMAHVSGEKIAIEKAMRTAASKDIRFPAHTNWLAQKRNSSLFRDHTLYSVIECIGNCCIISESVVAVGGDGSAFILPDEFNKVVRREKIEVRSEDDALKVAFEYVNSSAAIGRALLLSNVSDIPGSSPGNCGKGWSLEECKLIYDRSKNIINKLKDIITATNITIKHDSYVVTFFSWKDLGGIVEMWKIKVGKDGTASLLFHEVVAEEVGAYFVLR
ncbi:MAG: hypothetical protein ACP5KE_07080 [Candidatus Methanodesulfokora sp.]